MFAKPTLFAHSIEKIGGTWIGSEKAAFIVFCANVLRRCLVPGPEQGPAPNLVHGCV